MAEYWPFMLKKISNFIQKPKTKKVLLLTWVLLIATAIALYLIYPEEFTAEGIQHWIQQFNEAAIFIYLIISIARGIFFVPSTPFVLAGALLFPYQLWLVFIISMLGILSSGIFIYYAAQFLDFGNKHADKVGRIKEKIRKYGFWIVLGWSFFPIVPTDLVCYVAGRTKMNFWKYISALFIGEAILIALYLYFYQFFFGS